MATNPNGAWKLYMTDDRGVDSGVLAGGWRLNIQTMPGLQAPVLSVSRDGANLVIWWPESFGGFTLETAGSLTTPVTWTPVGIPPVQGGGRYTVTVPIAGGNAFFRLRAP